MTSLVVVVPLNSLAGQPAQTQCLEWFLFPPAWLQLLLLRHFCASDTESITLLLLHCRLPGPTSRVSAAGSDAKARGGSAAANNRRSQSFNNYDKSKPVTSPPPPPPPSSHEKGESPLGFFLSSFLQQIQFLWVSLVGGGVADRVVGMGPKDILDWQELCQQRH